MTDISVGEKNLKTQKLFYIWERTNFNFIMQKCVHVILLNYKDASPERWHEQEFRDNQEEKAFISLQRQLTLKLPREIMRLLPCQWFSAKSRAKFARYTGARMRWRYVRNTSVSGRPRGGTAGIIKHSKVPLSFPQHPEVLTAFSVESLEKMPRGKQVWAITTAHT